MSVQPAFALSVTPYKQQLAGHSATVTVSDRGTAPLTVKTSVVQLHGTGKGCGLAQTSGITVTPATFTLKPGQAEHTTVTLPAGMAAGDYGIVYGASGAGKGIHLTGAVGSQVLVSGAKTPTACTHHHTVAAPVHNSGSVPVTLIAAIAAVIVLLIIAAGLIVRRRRHAI